MTCIPLKQADTFGIIWLNKKVIILFVLLWRKCVLFHNAVLHFKSTWLWLNAPVWSGVFFSSFFFFFLMHCWLKAARLRQGKTWGCCASRSPNQMPGCLGQGQEGRRDFFARSGQRGLASCCRAWVPFVFLNQKEQKSIQSICIFCIKGQSFM